MEPISTHTLTVIVNPAAGPSQRAALERVRGALALVGVLPAFREVSPAEVGPAALEASREGGVVAVAGGDGTLSSAAASLAGTEAVLAPIPLGTRNHFARRLGIVSLAAAAEAVQRGRVHHAPVGRVAGMTFIHHASAGIYPAMVLRRERLPSRLGRHSATVLAALPVLLRLPRNRVLLVADGERREMQVNGVWVGLGPGSFRWPIDHRPTRGGCFEIVVSPARTRIALVASALKAFWLLRRGESLGRAGLEVMQAQDLVLEARRPIDVSLDGEVARVEPPLEFTLEPSSLRVLTLTESEDQDP